MVIEFTHRHDQTSRIVDVHLEIAGDQTHILRSEFEAKVPKLLVAQGLDRGSIDATRGALFSQRDGILRHYSTKKKIESHKLLRV